MTFPVEPGQEELTGLPSLRMWAAMAGVFLFGVALVIGLSAVPTHADAQAAVDVRQDGSWAHYQGQFANPTAVDEAPVDDEAHTIQSDGNDSDWYLTTLDELYQVPVRARVPGRSREVGDGVPDMDGDNQDAPGVSTALPDGDLDGDDDWEKKYSDEHLNSGDEKRPTSAMTSGYNSSTGMSARDDSSLLDGNDVDPVRDEEEGTSAVDGMTLENTNSTVLAKNPQNHDKNHHVRKNPVKNADKMTVMVMVGTVVTFSVVHRHQCMTQMPRWI
ncbi:uncharacterized protein LOC144926136 [Branchiostoma floridae x Branchiostoma belcheri]